jgi:hypothetical protein
MKIPLTKKKIRISIIVILAAMALTVNRWMPHALNEIRYQTDLSFTIEFGPTYWVEGCMSGFGEKGIKLLCATEKNAPRHASIGASMALSQVQAPKYFRLFADTYASPLTNVTIKQGIVQAVCGMYQYVRTESTSIANSKEIKVFLEKVIKDRATKEYYRDLAMRALCSNNIDQAVAFASNENLNISGRALLISAKSQPEKHLTAFASFLADTSKSEKLRESLAAEWAWSHRRINFKTAGGILDMPEKPEEIFHAALTAVRQDGEPHDGLRVRVWEWLYWQTGSGVPISLSNSQKTSRWLNSMADTVRRRWVNKNCGKGIPEPPHSEAIEKVLRCVTVPEVAESGENELNRLAMKFLNRKYPPPGTPKRPHETLTVQRAMKKLGFTDITVNEILSSDRLDDIRKLVPYLIQSDYFGPPEGKKKYRHRLPNIKSLRNLVKLGPEVIPILIPCYELNSFDLDALMDAIEICNPDHKKLLAWVKKKMQDKQFNFYSDRFIKLVKPMLAYDPELGITFIQERLADEHNRNGARRLVPVPANAPPANNIVTYNGKLHYQIAIRNCDTFRDRLKGMLPFKPDRKLKIISEATRDQAVVTLRKWVSRELKPEGLLSQICWIRPILVDKKGQRIVVYGDIKTRLETRKGWSSGSNSLGRWWAIHPGTKYKYLLLTAQYRENGQDKWQSFAAPMITDFSPGIRMLELRPVE